MGERTAEFIVSLTTDSTDVKSALALLKNEFRSTANDIESTMSKVRLFGELQDSIPKVKQNLASAVDELAAFATQAEKVRSVGGKVGDDLNRSLATANKAVKDVTSLLKSQETQSDSLRNALAKAGVETNNLAAAQSKLAEAARVATAAANEQAAKQALGLKTLSDVRPEIQRLVQAYATLKASGTLSATELASAHTSLQQKLAAVRGEVSGLQVGFKVFGTDIVSILNNFIAKSIGVGVAVEAIRAGFAAITEASNKFNESMGRIGTITNLSQAQLGRLGEEARAVARTLGIDLTEATNALYETVRSGVPPDNAISVLRVSAEAAKAAFTDTTSGVKAANLLISAFGVQVKDLGGAFDILVASQKNGGATLQEFADTAGPLLNVARAANISLADLSATLEVLVNSGIDAGTATSQLTKIITSLSDPGVVLKLRGLGIEVDGLANTFARMQKAGIPISQIVDIGVASTKSAAGVAALTSESSNLAVVFDRAQNAAGTIATALKKIADSAAENKRRFEASLTDYQTSMGQLVGSSSRLAAAVADIQEPFNRLLAAMRLTQAEAPPTEERLSRLVANFLALSPEAMKAAENMKAFVAAASGNGAVDKITAAIVALAPHLSAVVKDLQESTKALNDLAAQQIGALTKAAEAQIAEVEQARRDAQAVLTQQLQDSVAATTAALGAQVGLFTAAAQQARDAAAEVVDLGQLQTAAVAKSIEQLAEEASGFVDATKAASERAIATIAESALEIVRIQTETNKQRYLIIVENEAAIAKATDAAIAAERLARAKGGALTVEQERQLQADLARIRSDSLKPTIAQLQALFDALVGQERGYSTQVQSLAQGRLAFNEGIEKQIFETRIAALSAFDQYVAKAKEADRLVSLSRQAAAAGDTANAEKFGNQAIAIGNQLGVTYSANGSIVVSQSQSQADRLGIVKKVADSVNDAYKNAGGAARKGADDSKQAMDEVKGRLDGLLSIQKDMESKAAAGLKYKIEVDQKSYDAAAEKIAQLVAERTVLVNVAFGGGATSDLGGTPGVPGPVTGVPGSPFARGGFVQALARGGYTDVLHQSAFATGGPVHRLVQAFAGGGAVFRAPTWNKVPGVGNGDTVPALLEAGSFVVKQSSSQKYGDSAMRSLVQGFAIGGRVNNIGDIASRILTGGNGSLISQIIGLGAAGTGGTDLQKLKVKAWQELYPVIELARKLPQSGSEDDVAEYLTRVLGLINDTSDLANAQSLLSTVEPYLQQYLAGIQEALRYHVPYVVRHEKAEQLPKKLAAGGGVGTDTVPAMLTPGEYVIRPNAVQRIAQLFGGGFLPALNAMKVPRSILDGMMNFAPPPRPLAFAGGGMVPGGPLSSSSARASGALGGITININGAGVDLTNPESVRRAFLPVLRDIERRTAP